jgi:hypothetical protein
MSNVVVVQEAITPDQAQLLLQKNSGNRPLSESNVQFFYNQMVSGDWMLTGDTIKVSKDGRLLDGQHRLQAVVKYGKPVEMFVAKNCDSKIFQVLDTGKNRSASDILAVAGFKNVHNVAGAVKFILLFKSGNYTSGTRKQYRPTNADVLAFAEKNPELHEVITFTNSIYRGFRALSATTLAGLYFILSNKNQTACDDFFNKYSTGIDLTETSPIRLLRERFIKDSLNKSKLKTRDKVALFIFAWNAYIQKKKMQQLTLAKNYNFPKPI